MKYLKSRNIVFPLQRTDENLTFDETILAAAKSITTAVQTLVKAASEAQRELVAQGTVVEKRQLR